MTHLEKLIESGNCVDDYGIIKGEYCTIWHKNGECHREDGPAIEYTSGRKEYWIEGKVEKIVYSNGYVHFFR